MASSLGPYQHRIEAGSSLCRSFRRFQVLQIAERQGRNRSVRCTAEILGAYFHLLQSCPRTLRPRVPDIDTGISLVGTLGRYLWLKSTQAMPPVYVCSSWVETKAMTLYVGRLIPVSDRPGRVSLGEVRLCRCSRHLRAPPLSSGFRSILWSRPGGCLFDLWYYEGRWS